jgi:hypothetical protein
MPWKSAKSMAFGWLSNSFKSDCGILVSRAQRRTEADLYSFNLRDPISRCPLPVGKGNPKPPVVPGAPLNDLHDRVRYAAMILYRDTAGPPLNASETAWATGLVRERGLP